jgi:hypothetical protein
MRQLALFFCLGLIALVFSNDAPKELCPYFRGVNTPFEGEYRSWDLEARCLTNATKHYSRPGIFTNVTFHQTDEAKNAEAHQNGIVSTIEEAINRSLDLFASHAGSADRPLEIHVSLFDIIGPDWTNEDGPLVWFDEYGLESKKPTAEAASPCYLAVFHPFPSRHQPLFVIKNGLVAQMYRCVQQYHHHTMLAQDSENWWAWSMASFYASLAWRLPVQQHTGYIGSGIPHFWHWANSNGWSLANITEWMKAAKVAGDPGMPDRMLWEGEYKLLAADAEIRSLYRSFAPALVLGNITFPDGAPVPTVPPEEGDLKIKVVRPWGNDESPLRLSAGEERTPEGLTEPLAVQSWTMLVYNVALAGGQVLDVSIRPVAVHLGYWEEAKAEVGFDYSKDVHWSFRGVGELKFKPLAEGDTTARIEVPADAASAEYEFVVTCTGRYWSAELEFKVQRVE